MIRWYRMFHTVSLRTSLSTLWFSLVFFGSLNASWAADFQSPRTTGLGGAGVAGPLTNDSIYLNPSYASFLEAYSVSGSYSSVQDPTNEGRLLNVSVVDGRSPLFQAGVGYTVRPRDAWVHLGASKAVANRVSIGVGGKLIMDRGKPDAKEGTVALTVLPSDWLQLSLVGDNLIGDKDGAEKYHLNREVILGTKLLVMGMVVGYIDPHFFPSPHDKGNRFGFSLGGELTIFKDFFGRIGYFRNTNVPYASVRGQGLGLGLGWMAQRISLDYAFQRMQRSIAGIGNANSHVFGATIFF